MYGAFHRISGHFARKKEGYIVSGNTELTTKFHLITFYHTSQITNGKFSLMGTLDPVSFLFEVKRLFTGASEKMYIDIPRPTDRNIRRF